MEVNDERNDNFGLCKNVNLPNWPRVIDHKQETNSFFSFRKKGCCYIWQTKRTFSWILEAERPNNIRLDYLKMARTNLELLTSVKVFLIFLVNIKSWLLAAELFRGRCFWNAKKANVKITPTDGVDARIARLLIHFTSEYLRTIILKLFLFLTKITE